MSDRILLALEGNFLILILFGFALVVTLLILLYCCIKNHWCTSGRYRYRYRLPHIRIPALRKYSFYQLWLI